MYKIVYIGEKEKIETDLLSEKISSISGYKINFVKEKSVDTASNHFFSEFPVILMVIEENVAGMDDLVKELKKDESFKFMPIILILENNSVDIRKKYYKLGIDTFINNSFDIDEMTLACNSSIKNKIRLDQVVSQLGEVSEKNITKAIQLDLLKKFIPTTVWEKTEDLAENQDFEIPEEEQELAIIFADLQSFTTMAEKLSPREVIQMLNGIFDIATQIIYQNFGDIDKFIGDAFLSVFKNPEMAILSAVMIQDEIASYNENRKLSNQNISNFRMGIHYGKVIRGSVGGTVRFDNTLIGDPINTAQRLESMSPPGGLLVSKNIISRIKCFENMDIPFTSYVLKGKNREIEASLFYDYYLKNPHIKSLLFKERIRIEEENSL